MTHAISPSLPLSLPIRDLHATGDECYDAVFQSSTPPHPLGLDLKDVVVARVLASYQGSTLARVAMVFSSCRYMFLGDG